MNAIENFRAAFRLHLGDEKYRVFLKHSSGRRHAWQEEMLGEFFESHPEHRLSDDQLEGALRICEIHGVDLQSEKAKVSFGCPDYTLEYLDDRDRLFPHAGLEPIEDTGDVDTTIWYCSECRAVQMRHEKWRPGA